MPDNSVLVAVAYGKRNGKPDGKRYVLNSWGKDDAATDKPLTYCDNMNRSCRSHTGFHLLAMGWQEALEKIEGKV